MNTLTPLGKLVAALGAIAILLGGAWWYVRGQEAPAVTEVVVNTPTDSTPTAPVSNGNDTPTTDNNQPPSDNGDDESSNDSNGETTNLPARVSIAVPFVAQAPYGDWDDPRQQDGCEEASLIMAKYWIADESLNNEKGLKAILDSWAWQEKNLGAHPSLSVADTIRLAKEYFGIKTIRSQANATATDIRAALAAGSVVIVPVDGRELGNPYFTPPGPPEHMLLIKGYDDKTGEFITNDPGTRHGRDYRYAYATMENALQEYPTGHREPVTSVKKTMIVVGK